jgi:N-acylneuraminate cytidylyltransferase
MHEPYNMPRQKLPPTFWQTGHLDVIRARTILEKKSMTGDYVLPIPVDPSYAVDIDSQADLDRAGAILRNGRIDLAKPGDDSPANRAARRESRRAGLD